MHDSFNILKIVDANYILHYIGPWALWISLLIIFIECGLFIGIILPGDSLLFTIGFLISTDFITTNIWLSIVLLLLMAILGNILGYWIGTKLKQTFFTKERRFVKSHHIQKTEHFFRSHGPFAILLARFIPVVRSLITMLAGIGAMPARLFFTYTILGAIVWVVTLTYAGYLLGEIDIVANNLEVAILAIIAVSFLPLLFKWIKEKKRT